jgi:hypothetical protein
MMFIQILAKELIEQDIIKRSDDDKTIRTKVLSHLARVIYNQEIIFYDLYIIKNMANDIVRIEISLPINALRKNNEEISCIY